MAVPSSGQISLNDFHVEAGGTSGSACTLNDADIRGLISKGSGAAMNFGEWYGASGSVHTTAFVSVYQASQYTPSSGFLESGGQGSMTDNTIASYGSGNQTTIKITQLRNYAGTLIFGLEPSSGTYDAGNSGWTTLNVYYGQTNASGSADLSIARTSMNYNGNSSGATWSINGSYATGTVFGESNTNNFLELL
jgi:hypothetical protein